MVEVEWMDVVFLQYPDLLSVECPKVSSSYYFRRHYQMLPKKECTKHLNLDLF